jgi:hypothetical protein
MAALKRFHVVQERRYFQHYQVAAESKAEAARIARGDQPGQKLSVGRSPERDHQLPKIKETPSS